MRWDAYAGNVRGGATASDVADAVARSAIGRVERARPRGRYHDVFEVKDAGEPVGWVAHDPMLDTAYFEVKGERTPLVADAIRRYWAAKHSVSRADACEDFEHPDAYAQLRDLVDRTKDPRVKSMAITPRDGDRGETIYWGSPTSGAMVRLYEAGKMKERLHFGRPDWKRLELQVRPGKSSGKCALASMTPLDAWGMSRWTWRVAELVSQVDVPRFVYDQPPPTFERTTLYVARAFRRHFEEMLSDFGDWRCVGEEIRAVWAADDLAAEQTSRAARGSDGVKT